MLWIHNILALLLNVEVILGSAVLFSFGLNLQPLLQKPLGATPKRHCRQFLMTASIPPFSRLFPDLND